jgi:hypothetical protein
MTTELLTFPSCCKTDSGIEFALFAFDVWNCFASFPISNVPLGLE